ncbi:MAG TPA: hypothetical protein VF454_00635, partial [Gemmatimonadales bacterium]
MSIGSWLFGAVVGGGAGYALARFRGQGAEGRGPGGSILPAPSVRWLREAYGALGVWTLGRGESALPEAA